MKKAKFISSMVKATLKQTKSYSTLTQSTMFNLPVPKNFINTFTVLAQTEKKLSEIKNISPVQHEASREKQILADYLADKYELVTQLIEQKKFSAAIKACEACLEPYNNGQLVTPTDELKNLYKLYIETKDTGASPIERRELLQVLDKAIELFPSDVEFKEKKQYMLGSIEINKLINEGSLKLS